MGRIEAQALPDFLSGILIGIEIGSATRLRSPARVTAKVTVLGDDALASRYERALRRAGIAAVRAPADATARGLWRVAVAAGLVDEGSAT